MSTKSTVPEHVQLTRIPTAGQLPPPPAGQQLPPPSFDREGFLRRSLTLTSKADRANLIHSLTERISQRMNNAAVQPPTARVVSTHHVIPVNFYSGKLLKGVSSISAVTNNPNQKFNIPISIDISIKTHQFVCIR